MKTRRRVPAVTQITSTECGLCVAVALLRYYGRSEEISEVREHLDAGRDGVRLTEVGAYLSSRGMQVKTFRAKSIDALAGFTSPVILFWEDAHFVVLEDFDGTVAKIMDPAIGRRRISRDELEAGCNGAALWAYPDDGFETRRAQPLAEWRQTKFLPVGAAAQIAMVSLLSLVSYVALLGVPLLTKWAVDQRSTLADTSRLMTVLLAVLAMAIGYFVLHAVRTRVLSLLLERVGSIMMRDTFAKLLRLPYRFFSTRQPGELLFRLNSVNTIRDLLTTKIAQGLMDAGTFLAVSVYIVWVDWRIAIAAAVLVLINSVTVGATRGQLLELVDEEISQSSKSQTMQLDAVVSIPSIRLGGYEDDFIDRWDSVYAKSMSAMRRRLVLQEGKVGGLAVATSSFGPVLLLLLSLGFVQNGSISLGSAIALQTISATYFGLASSVFGTYAEFAEASRYLARINEITAAEPESAGGVRTALPSASFVLDSVDFTYNAGGPKILHGIDLHVREGERVAIVGESGSGKSTLARLICTLYEPTAGEISYGGAPAAEFNRVALRRSIGFVPQETHMHNRSILENLTLGRDIPMDEVVELCGEIGILELIEELPMGFHTMITEMGANFSGGQRQRFAIARTLLQRPQILVLDEATASLDSVNERRITEHLRRLGTTQVVIAHRLETIRHADRIVVMAAGRIVESGCHDSLVADGGSYAALYASSAPESGRQTVEKELVDAIGS